MLRGENIARHLLHIYNTCQGNMHMDFSWLGLKWISSSFIVVVTFLFLVNIFSRTQYTLNYTTHFANCHWNFDCCMIDCMRHWRKKDLKTNTSLIMKTEYKPHRRIQDRIQHCTARTQRSLRKSHWAVPLKCSPLNHQRKSYPGRFMTKYFLSWEIKYQMVFFLLSTFGSYE